MIIKYQGKPSIHTPAITLQKILKKPRQHRRKNLELCKQKTTNTQNLTSFNKQTATKTPFRMLKSSSYDENGTYQNKS
jgi:hypothetical protein